MLIPALRVWRVQLLAGGLHLHRGFPADGRGPLSKDLADFPHGGQILRLLDAFIPVLAAHAAAGLLAGLLRVALAGALTLGILSVLCLFSSLTFLGVALLAAILRLAFLAGLLFAVLLALALAALLISLRLLVAGLALLRFHSRQQVLGKILDLAHQAGVLTG